MTAAASAFVPVKRPAPYQRIDRRKTHQKTVARALATIRPREALAFLAWLAPEVL